MTDTALPTLTRFDLTLDNHVAHLRLNRPERMNSMDPVFWGELDRTLKHLHRSGEARALVISVRIPLMADSDSISIADSVPGDGGHVARVS